MTIEQYLAECKQLFNGIVDYDYEAFANDYCVASAIIDGIQPKVAVSNWIKRQGLDGWVH